MENYLWVAMAAAMSLAIFLFWVWRDRRLGESPLRGIEGSAAVLAETATALPEVSRD